MPTEQAAGEKSPLTRIDFKISRFKPDMIDPPRFQNFFLEVDETMTVLDALEKIRISLDATLVYRHSCYHSACGTCACVINGRERLACTTRILALKERTIILEPLRGFPRIADLAVDMTGFYRDIDPQWLTIRPAEPVPGASANHQTAAGRLEDCIECGACVSSCPAAHDRPDFMGPAALAALHNEMKKASAVRRRALLEIAGKPRGERSCRRALNCSRVCPTHVYPARHIADLRREAASAMARGGKL